MQNLRSFTFVALSIVLCMQATENHARTAQDCATISNADDRLSCFDSLFVQAASPAATGNWRVTDEQSTLDDSRRVVLSVKSEDNLRARFGRGSPADLIIRCEENTTSLYIVWGGHFMADINNGGRVDYRIDQQSPDRITMRVSNDNQALGLWRGNQAIPFIRKLLDADRIYVRATPFSESRVEADFVISGLTETIQPLREACNW